MAYGAVLNWGAEVASVALFTQSTPNIPIATFFEKCFGQAPSNIHDSVQGAGRIGSAGKIFNGLTHAILVAPGRVDVNLQPPESSSLPTSPPLITDVAATLEAVSNFAKTAVGDVGPITRIAMNLRLASHHKTVEEANKKVLEILTAKLLLNDEVDFIYQINSPKRIDGFNINRIIRWSVENVQMIAAPTVGAHNMSTSQQVLNQFYSAFAHLDFNTVFAPTTFSPSEAVKVIDALIAEAARVRKESLRLK